MSWLFQDPSKSQSIPDSSLRTHPTKGVLDGLTQGDRPTLGADQPRKQKQRWVGISNRPIPCYTGHPFYVMLFLTHISSAH